MPQVIAMQKSIFFAASLLVFLTSASSQADEDVNKESPSAKEAVADEAKDEKDKPSPPKEESPKAVLPDEKVVTAAPPVLPQSNKAPETNPVGALIQTFDPMPPGNDVAGFLFGEDRPPPGDPRNPKAMRIAMHGYFRAPLRIGWRERTAPKPDEATNDIRTPWLVDDDYFRSGFLYTRNAESDWTELYVMAGNHYVTATIALEGTLFSDWARPIIDKQLGITKGWLTFRHAFDLPGNAKLRLQIKGGAFSDRYGWQEKYDTYLFGRTHQMGERIRADLDVGKFSFSVAHGFGARLEAIESNQGLALLSHLRLGVSYNKALEASFYHLTSFTQDKRQLKEITDANVDVVGFEMRGDGGALGRAAVDISSVSAKKGSFIAPAIEVMHSAGGRGLEENYFGTEKSDKGTGSLLNLGFQYDVSASKLLKKFAGMNMGQADANLSLFGMYTKVTSDQKDDDPQVNRDGRQLFKWGAELAAWPFSFLGASLRYDRVIFDIVDDPSAFRVISPRITVRTHWLGDALLFLQWSHYVYGERVFLRPGQVPLETMPDQDLIKIQAQMSF